MLLQRPHAHLVPVNGLNTLHSRPQALDRGDARDSPADSRRPDFIAVPPEARLARPAERRVHNQVDLTIQDPFDDRRLTVGSLTLAVLAHDRRIDSVPAQNLVRSAR